MSPKYVVILAYYGSYLVVCLINRHLSACLIGFSKKGGLNVVKGNNSYCRR